MKDFRTDLKKKPKSRLDIIKENRLKRKSTSKGYKVTAKRGIFRRRKLSKKVKKILLVILLVLVIGMAVGGIRVMAYLQELNDNLPTPDKVFPELPVASEIYDRKAIANDGTGTTLYRLFGQFNSDPVDIKQIPESVKWSFLAAEDSDFYTHGGFDVAGLVRCGLAYLRTRSVACGGSTITQQLVKITALTSDPSIERKIKELLLSTKVEQLYDKDTILEMYLRVAPFGSNIYGVKTAANFYFGKEPKDLDLAQATILAAIIQDPVRLSPTLSIDKTLVYCRSSDGFIIADSNVVTNKDGTFSDGGNEVIKTSRVKCRQLYILNQMELKMKQINDQTRTNKGDPNYPDVLTEDMITAAKKEELVYKAPIFDKKAGHFVDYVLEALETRNYNNNGTQPFTVDELQKGGYKIYTSLDYGIQQIAENYVQKAVNDNAQYNMNNAAVMTVIPSTGEIISMAGSKDYNGASLPAGCTSGVDCKFDGQVNIFTSPQSPGSSNKPLAFYLAYDEGDIFPGSLLPDIPMDNIDASGYSPKDWNGGYEGLGTASQMLRDSRNLPAIQVIKKIGVQKYLDTAKKWGYTNYTDDSQYGLSVVLGGADVYPDEHAQAYTVFANEGDLVKLNPVLKIVDRDGKTVYEAKPDRTNVATAQGTYLVNETLLNLHNISWDGRDVSAKTGTSEDSKDAWIIAWSPDFVTEAWGGNNNNEPMDQSNGYPPIVIQPWLVPYMSDIGGASYFAAKTSFPRPGYVSQAGGGCTDQGCQGLQVDWTIDGKAPPRDILKKTFTVCTDEPDHLARPIDIAMGKSVSKEFIHYTLLVPEWQHYLDDYLKNVENKPNVFPTQPCDIDRSGGTSGPFFSFSSVTATPSTLTIKGGVYTSGGATINSVSFLFDNHAISCGSIADYNSFSITCDISGLGLVDSASYSFNANATDSKGATGSANTITVNVGAATTSNISFITPPFVNNALPNNVDVQFSGSYSINNVRLWLVKNGGAATLVGTMSAIGGNKYRFPLWTNSGSGNYKFYTTASITGSATGMITSNNSPDVNI